MKSFYRNILVVMLVGVKGLLVVAHEFSDQPCNARATANNSVVCVCTASYCDTVIRETPSGSTYYTYTTSKSGKRFYKSSGNLDERGSDIFNIFYEGGSLFDNSKITTIELCPSKKYQTILGMGGAVTDAAAINWRNLSDANLMKNLISSYCGSAGIEYSMLRVPMGASDFSTHKYTYNDFPENDVKLSNFTLADEDKKYKIPMIKACMEASKNPVKVLGSLWFSPSWMKDNSTGHIKNEYYQAFADYYYKFVETYDQGGVNIWGLTLANEPLNAVLDIQIKGGPVWNIPDLATWLENNLGPTIRESKYKDIKILTCDDQRFAISLWYNLLVQNYPRTNQYLDGVAVHFYFDKDVPAALMTQAMAQSPEKFLLYTEACNGIKTGVDFGSWTYAENYILNIIENFNYNVTGWLDWNMVLNMQGGPSFYGTKVDASIVVDAEAGEFYKQPMFYAIGHFSKFIPPGSQRIDSKMENSADIKNVAFLTPQNTIVLVLYNTGPTRQRIFIRMEGRLTAIKVDASSITTAEFPYRDSSN